MKKVFETKLISDFRSFIGEQFKCKESDITKVTVCGSGISFEGDFAAYVISAEGKNGKLCNDFDGFMWITDLDYRCGYNISEFLDFINWCFEKGYCVAFNSAEIEIKKNCPTGAEVKIKKQEVKND